MSAASPTIVPRPPRARSRVTNGHALLPGIDGRSATARRYHDICSQLVTDAGGAGQMSEARLQLVRRFAAASCLAEALEARLAAGEQIDITQHSLLASTLCRLSQRIGIDRRARDITPPDPLDYAQAIDEAAP
jgi:hypothetical protein